MKRKNMKALHLSVWMTLILITINVISVWAWDDKYYSTLTLTSSNEAYGKVYASNAKEESISDNKYGSSKSVTSDNQTSSGGSPTMYLYAKEYRGGKFVQWTSKNFTPAEANEKNTSAELPSPWYDGKELHDASRTENNKKHYKDYSATAEFEPVNSITIPFLAVDAETRSYCSYTVKSNMEAGVSPNDQNSWTIQNQELPTNITMFENEEFTLTAQVTARGYGFVQWFVEKDDQRKTLPGGQGETNHVTVSYGQLKPVVETGVSVGAEFKKKAFANISYWEATDPEGNKLGSTCTYSAIGADANGIAYPTITIGGAVVTTYEDDKISLKVTKIPAEKALYRYYYVDKNDKKRLLGALFTATQTVTIPMDAKAVGAEFVTMRYADITYQPATDGTYKVDAKTTDQADFSLTITTVEQTKNTLVSAPVTLTATPAPGKMLYRWYSMDKNGIKSQIGELFTNPQSVGIPESGKKVGAEFVDIKPFMVVGEGIYGNLSDALQVAATSTSKLIKVIQDATVTAGYYTIPSDVTLLIPYSGQTAPQAKIERLEGFTGATAPSKAYKLTLAPGVHMDVFGTIEAGGKQASGGPGASGSGVPKNSYGQLDLQEGSEIVLSGASAKLRAWGFVTGAGKIDVRRGATVYEQFQIYDWKGGTITTSIMNNTQGFFPVNQYFIQNVEASATYHPGSSLIAATSVYVRQTVAAAEVKIIGVDGETALFLMNNEDDSEDTWVRKKYDVTNDKQVYEINSSASLGSIIIDIAGYTMKSQDYVLPITNNMKIHLLSGEMNITQSTVLLPGSEIEINKTATVVINSGQNLYLYDKDQWGKYVYNGVYGQKVLYSPSFPATNGKPNQREYAGSTTATNDKLNDATMFVKGTFDVQGALYTTAGGANIYSTKEDAGTVKFSSPAEGSGSVYQYHTFVFGKIPVVNISYLKDYTKQEAPCTSAKLKNEDGSTYSGGDGFSETAGTQAGQSFCFMDIDGDEKCEWVSLTTDEENCGFVYDQYGTYYAKPGAYVAINAKKEDGFIIGNDDHTYSDAAGKGRLFILMPDCQWWEVEIRDNLYYCKDNGKYYYYDSENSETWMEKKFNVYWKNYDGSIIATYPLTYGSIPNYLGSNPTRPEDIDFTYSFNGWSPAITPVTGDATYIATYQSTQKKYTIRFLNEEDGEIERQQLARGEIPSCSTAPTKAGKYLVWSPTIAAVTGNAVYRATYLDAEPTEFTITWNNYNGTEIYHETVAKNATPAYNNATAIGHAGVDAEGTPVKNLGNEYTYTFTGWSPAIVPATENKAYTALFDVAKKKGTITFVNENGVTISEQEVEYGLTPVAPAYTKQNQEPGHIYTLGWKLSPSKIVTGIQSVTGDATYIASFTDEIKKITISIETSIPGVAVITGAGIYDYNAAEDAVTISVVPNMGYELKKWQIKNGDVYEDLLDKPESFTTSATESKTYKAVLGEGDLVVGLNEALEVTKPTTVPNLILQASAGASGQLRNIANLTITGNVYFDLTLNTAARHWHAFGVPWVVNLNENPLIEVETGRTLTLGSHYEIVYYDTHTRATQGPGAHCWKYLKHYDQQGQPIDLLTPGKGYMIAFTSSVQTVRFVKKSGEPIFFNGTVNVSGEGTGSDQGINAIANPMAYHATMAAGPAVGYVHDGGEIGSDGYDEYDIDGKSFIVGKAVYVQVTSPSTVTVNPSSAEPISPKAAPARRAAKATDKEYLSLSDYYHVSIASESIKGGSVYVLPEEDKEDQYVIGHDLSKFGMSTKKPQIWVKRYDVNLGLNTTAPINDVAEFPVNLYAPASGEYTLSLAAQPDDDYIVYLTLNGEAIWNLSDGAYTLSLAAGTNKSYGLRLSANKAPEVATGMDEAIIDAQGETKKVLINNQVFIIRGEKVYTIDGQMVK